MSPLKRWRGCTNTKGKSSSSKCPTFVQYFSEIPSILASRVVQGGDDRRIRVSEGPIADVCWLWASIDRSPALQTKLNENTKITQKALLPPKVLILFWEEMFSLGLWLKVRKGAHLESALGFHHILYPGCLREKPGFITLKHVNFRAQL